MPGQDDGNGYRVVAGVDGSPSSLAALRWAVRQAELTGGTVDAVMAWQSPAASGLAWGEAVSDPADYQGLTAKALDEAVERAVSPDRTVRVRRLVGEGHPADVLLDAAEGADVLVVGSRGRGGFARALLGSVSQDCTFHAPCPVVVIREQE